MFLYHSVHLYIHCLSVRVRIKCTIESDVSGLTHAVAMRMSEHFTDRDNNKHRERGPLWTDGVHGVVFVAGIKSAATTN